MYYLLQLHVYYYLVLLAVSVERKQIKENVSLNSKWSLLLDKIKNTFFTETYNFEFNIKMLPSSFSGFGSMLASSL